MPDELERREILAIHLRQRNRDLEQYDLNAVASAIDGYSGADIEQVMITGLKLAFHEGHELGTESLLAAVPELLLETEVGAVVLGLGLLGFPRSPHAGLDLPQVRAAMPVTLGAWCQ